MNEKLKKRIISTISKALERIDGECSEIHFIVDINCEQIIVISEKES